MSRIDWSRSLAGAVCKLSPFGSHDTPEQCESTTNCSARWRCARAEGENDIFGVFHEGGSALIALDGTFDTEEECVCYMCDPGGAGCVPTDGVNGDHTDPSCSNSCVYGYVLDETGECVLTLGGSDTLEACQIQDDNQNSWKYGCFTKFANRYGVCVGIPDTGENGPREGEQYYDSIESCENPITCPDTRHISIDGSACLFPEGCNPLPGTWQMWRVGSRNSWYDTPRWASTIIPNAQIHWNPPEWGVTELPLRTVTSEYPEMMGEDGTNTDWSNIPRLWYTSVERYDPNDVPALSIAFRRLDVNTVEVVIHATTYTHTYNPDATEPADDPPKRGEGLAVFDMYAPAGKCFVMPSLDFHGEFQSAARLNMRISPMNFTGDEFVGKPCIQGEMDSSGGCACNSVGHGDSCEYTCVGDEVFSGFDSEGYPTCV